MCKAFSFPGIKPDPTLQPMCKMVCDLSRCRSMFIFYIRVKYAHVGAYA